MPPIVGLSAECPSVASLNTRNTVKTSAFTRSTSHRRESGPAAGRGRFRHLQMRSSEQTAHPVVQRVDMQVKKIKPHRHSLPQQTTAFKIIDSTLCKTRACLVQQKMEFLRGDLTHLFDDHGIDQSAYDAKVNFEDPITRYSTVKGVYLQRCLLCIAV